MTVADRWMARAQRKSDERAARWQELEPLRRLVTAAPIRGPGGSAAVISVDQSGARWLSPLNPDGSIGPGGPVELLRLLVTEAIWLVVFRRSYTVQVRTNDHPPIKAHVRLASEMAACHAAAQLVSRFQDDEPVAVQSWRAELRPAPIPPLDCLRRLLNCLRRGLRLKAATRRAGDIDIAVAGLHPVFPG
jgi:hypothetical protein